MERHFGGLAIHTTVLLSKQSRENPDCTKFEQRQQEQISSVMQTEPSSVNLNDCPSTLHFEGVSSPKFLHF